jgi:hypothetical protein
VGLARYRQVVAGARLLAEHASAGLRLIEIERDHLADLPRVVEQLQKLPQRFILFCDDLSFEAGEGDYRVLKSVLDGSLEQARTTCCCTPPPTAATWCRKRRATTKTGSGRRRAAPQRSGGRQDCPV